MFLAAFFLRFESDLLIVGVFGAFAIAVLGALRWIGRTQWRADVMPNAAPGEHLERGFAHLVADASVQRLTLVAMGAGLAAYVAMTLAVSRQVGSDLGILCLGVLATFLIVMRVTRTESSRSWVDRAAAYVGVVMVVYLDQTTPAKSEWISGVSWTLLAITGSAALLRFWRSPARRFEVTSLDVLVIFIAIVLPHLSGAIPLPPDLPAGITKAIILLYVVEVLFGIELKRGVPRAALALTFGVIAARWLVAPIL
jgi:hypothetical protein